jgi:cytokinin dehydrogenase
MVVDLVDALGRATGASVVIEESAAAPFKYDFGRVVKGSPIALVRPVDTEQVQRVLTFVAAEGLSVTVRGTGHGQSGQSVALDSLTLDLSRLNRVEPPDMETLTIRCQAGALLREVVDALAPAGAALPTIPSFVDLSVGGVLSAGGVGAGLPLFGPTVANVRAVDVVTGEGDLVHATRDAEPDVFHGVLCGLGRFGVIVSADLAIRRAKPAVRTFHLDYEDHDLCLRDQASLAGRRTDDILDLVGVYGTFRPSLARSLGLATVPGLGDLPQWDYRLDASVEFAPGEDPLEGELLDGLAPSRVVGSTDLPNSTFPFRFDHSFEIGRRNGVFRLANPYFECFLTPSAMSDVVPKALGSLPPWLGHGELLWMPTAGLPRFFVVPEGTAVAGFALLATGVAPERVAECLGTLRSLHGLFIEADGKRYHSGWLGMVEEQGWRRHFGDRLEEWLTVKRRLDPKAIFRSALRLPE